MPLEIAVRGFAIKKGIKLEKTETGFSGGADGRLQIKSIQGQDGHVYLCGRLFALRPLYESSVYISESASGRELTVMVRFGCLRDYLHQLYASKRKFLIDLRERLETHLNYDKNPEDFVRERFTEFNSSNLYQLLNRFYP